MPRLVSGLVPTPARIDQFNTHFTRDEYHHFLCLATWHRQNAHVWLRETITRQYARDFLKASAEVRAAVLEEVEAFLRAVDAEHTARRTRAAAFAVAQPPRSQPRSGGDTGTDADADVAFTPAATAATAADKPQRRAAGPSRPLPGTRDTSGDRARAEAWARFRERALSEDERENEHENAAGGATGASGAD